MRKCICLYSGGLDSRLVIALMARQPEIEVIAYHGLHCFEGRETFAEVQERVTKECLELGAAKVVFRDMTAQITELLFHNRYGYGKNLNPCLDCRINTVSNGFAVMKQEGADFVCSGEVLGQRPKSQQRDGMQAVINRAERSGYAGLLLRPLCAKLMEPTVPETQGWVERERLYDFSGRSRNPQFVLAQELGVVDYPAPAGGCLLTDENFCRRLQDLLEERKSAAAIGNADLDLLKFGRHYRAAGGYKVITARNAEEGDRLDELACPGDRLCITAEKPGALVLLRPPYDAASGAVQPGQEEALRIACGLAVYNSKFREAGNAGVEVTQAGAGLPAELLPDCAAVAPQTPGIVSL